jgi:hypothetical protein
LNEPIPSTGPDRTGSREPASRAADALGERPDRIPAPAHARLHQLSATLHGFGGSPVRRAEPGCPRSPLPIVIAGGWWLIVSVDSSLVDSWA